MIKNILETDFKYENDKLYRLSKWTSKWNCCNDLKPKSSKYIQVLINKKKYYLHRLIYKYHNEDFDITDNSKNNQIDHININPSDNRIENLRVVNHTENQRNRKKRENTTSKYIGVSWVKKSNKWLATITINRKVKYLGRFDNEEEAAEAHKAANKSVGK